MFTQIFITACFFFLVAFVILASIVLTPDDDGFDYRDGPID